MQPTVTVLMPNYNNERFLKEAIDSILKQTFINFTFLIVDDGSTDKSVEIIKGYNDPRIVLIQKEQNSGIVDALNIGIKQINSNYLVRMDGDDISLPQRIQTLTDFMEKNPTVGVCSSQMKLFGNDHQITNYYLESDALKAQLIFNSGLSHPCSIFRTSVLKEHHFQYHHTHPYMEDYDLFYRMKDHTTFANINQVLYHYRLSAHNSTVKNQNTALDRKRGLYKYILTDLQIEPTTKNIELQQFR